MSISQRLVSLAIAATALAAGGRNPAPRTSRHVAVSSAWDVTYYHLDLRLDPVARSVAGAVTLRATARAALSVIALDLDSVLAVDSATSAGRVLHVGRAGDQVFVTLPAAVARGRAFSVAVFYHGVPRGQALVFDTLHAAPIIGSYGLPYSARAWWPSKDTPRDKADSADIEFTLPAGLTVVSNGRLVGRRDNPDGSVTTHWAAHYPIYPDVVSIAAAEYRSFVLQYRSASGVTMPMPFFVYADDSAKAYADFSVLPEIMNQHVARFGEYPFLREKYGVAEFPVPSFREHQTIPSWGRRMVTGDHRNDIWLAHELAHQWFGNALSLQSWSDVWLNEGFATYAALLWIEHRGGTPGYQAAIQARMQLRFPHPVYRPDSSDVGSMFDAVTFQKGALVLHMLRHVMGDSGFFVAMKRYVHHHLYGNVTTADFERECEAVYGRSLGWFFREWVYGTGQPRYHVEWLPDSASGGRSGDVVVSQLQDSTTFTMPVDVRLTDRTGATRELTARDSLRRQLFRVTMPDSVTAAVIDPDHWVLRTP